MRRILALALLVAVSGCNAGEIAALEKARDQRAAVRARLAYSSKELLELKKRAAESRAEWERFSLWRSDGDPAARMKALSSRGGALASYARDGDDWKITLTGKGGGAAAMATLARIQGPGFVVTRIEVGPSAWSADLRTRNAEDAAGGAADGSPAFAAVPPAGMFPSSRRTELHAEIQKLDSEIAQLEEIVGVVREIEQWQAVVTRESEAIKTDPSRLGRVLEAAEPLFAGSAPFLASGTIDVTAGGYVVRGTCADGVTGETLAGRKPAGWELRKLEGKTIELSR